jgi:hypothetical protein
MKVTLIKGKIKEARTKWFGHVTRRDDDHIVRKILDIQDSFVEIDRREQNPEEATVKGIKSWNLSIKRALNK